jgi:phosphoenolpyruvate carboxykinase (GTP)
MAMKPFCGYNFADYWAHWLSFPDRARALPRIFHVNWFRRDKAGKFLWPGYGDNLRVLRWMIDRCAGRIEARDTPIGYLPRRTDIDTAGLEITPAAMDELLAVDPALWRREMQEIGEYLRSFGSRMPPRLLAEHHKALERLGT